MPKQPQKIQKLSQDVINQIAAGEVVERPAHLVKELIENSLDAESSFVHVEVGNGGRNVQVTDNGIGINSDDLAIALERHATSKIAETDDLWKLKSFGFRGEALASIGSVCKLTLTSRTKKSDKAHQVVSDFGKVSKVETVGGIQGTRISIQDLFQNIPARLKFLKSSAAELAQIKNVIKAVALSYSDVEFKLFNEKELSLFYPKAENRLERVKAVLEVEEMFESFFEGDGIKVHCVFASPHETQKTSKSIWTFAQSRWIQDRSVQAAVTEAFRSTLMHGEYPVCVVWIEVPTEQVDVNIHPTKSQVKFLNPQAVFRAVHHGLRKELEKGPWVRKTEAPAFEQPIPETFRFNDPALNVTALKKISLDRDSMMRASVSQKDFGTSSSNFNFSSATLSQETPSTEIEQAEASFAPGFWSSLQVIGQVHNTYIVCQSDKNLVLVDQHAAHERVMFERLFKGWYEGRMPAQDFLFPLVMDLSPEKMEAVMTMAPELKKWGMELEQMGPESLGIKSAPMNFKDASITKTLEKLAEDIVEKAGSFYFEKQLIDLCATMACHSAIRAGQSLSIEEARSLLRSMDEFPLSSFCPHGRPVSLDYSFYEIEKRFGRIV